MSEAEESGRVFSRRDVLKGAPLAVVASAVLGAVSATPFLSRLTRGRRPPTFPKGSIFTPAKDVRKDRV